MSEGFSGTETVRISFPDGAWVDVKAELTQEDQDYILNLLGHVSGQKVEVTLGRMSLLERAIVSWSFDEPVDHDHINTLRMKYRSKVLTELDKLYSTEDFSKK
jgi:hypothetical protein